MATAVHTKLQPTFAVLDNDGHVVVLFAGSDAADAGQEWAQRGYQVVDLSK